MKRDIQSLQKRILMIATLPSVVISILMGTIYMIVRFTELDNQFLSKALSYTQHQAALISYLQPDNRDDELEARLNQILADENVNGISVVDSDGNTIIHAGTRHAQLVPMRTLQANRPLW